MIDVVLAAPIRAYREAVAEALQASTTIREVLHAQDGAEAMAQVERRRPDVALVDFSLDRLEAVVKTMCRLSPSTRLVAIGVNPEDSRVILAAEAGVCGFVEADRPMPALVESVAQALRNEAPCGPRIAAILLQGLRSRPSPLQQSVVSELTQREQLVAHLAAGGLTNRQIAGQLVVGESTVKTHMHAVLRKLGLERRHQLADHPGLDRVSWMPSNSPPVESTMEQ